MYNEYQEDLADEFCDQGKHSLQELITQSPIHPIICKSLRLTNPDLRDKDIALIGKNFKGLVKVTISTSRFIRGSTLGTLPSTVKILDLEGCENVSDEGIEQLQKLTSLRILSLASLSMTTAKFDFLPTSLVELIFGWAEYFIDSGLLKLKHLVNLKTLIIKHGDELTGSTLGNLPVSLETLELTKCKKLEEENLKNLKYLVNLKTLTIQFSEITGKFIGELPISIEKLLFFQCHKLSEGMKELSRLENLKELRFDAASKPAIANVSSKIFNLPHFESIKFV